MNCTKDYLKMLIFQHFEIVLFFMLSVAVVQRGNTFAFFKNF